MTSRLLLPAALALAAIPVAAEEGHRELGAHEHGHSSLNIAIAGGRIEMELEAPGADIVGFEHAATSDGDKAAVEAAEAKLANPLELFVLPEAAGCVVESASVEIEGETGRDHEVEHAEHEGKEEHEDHVEANHDEHGANTGHNEFHALYALSCTDPAAIDGVTFAFFDSFTGAQEIEVSIIGENGQSSFEVERDRPRIELQGLM